jgi:hypothetical protein
MRTKTPFDACTSYLALKTFLHHPREVTANMSSNTKMANLCFGLPR